MNTEISMRSSKPSESRSAPDHATQAPRRRRTFRILLLVVLILSGGVWGARAIHRMLEREETDDAYVAARVHQAASRISGTVLEVLVEENTEVKKGDVLARLDPRDTQSRVNQATAQLEQSEAQLTQSTSQIADAKARIAQAEAQLEKADSDYNRVKNLAAMKVASKQELDAATAAFEAGKAGVESARAAAKAAEAWSQVVEAQKRTAQTVLEDARLQNSYTVITAPVSGKVGRRNVEVGNHLQPGQPIFAIVEPEVWVEANFKETQLARMRPGLDVEVAIDAIPGAAFSGTIESFSPASGATFALLPADNATGNFTKVVQRVPVRIQLSNSSTRDFAGRLRPGLSAIVSVRVK